MIAKKNIETWFGYHLYASFFESFSSYTQIMGIHLTEDLQQHYDDLFQGTDANIKIPLWTSACKHQGPILMNETTLEVIKFYYKWGFKPQPIDGHPMDYIGTQFRFLEYLQACDCTQTIEDFKQLSLLDTLTTVVKEVRAVSKEPEILGVMDAMLTFVTTGKIPEVLLPIKSQQLTALPSFEASQKGLNPEILPEEKKLIRTGGFNNCGGKCVIHAHVQEGCILNITTDCSENDPQIRACVRGGGYRHTYFNTDRLRYPMKRVGKRGEGKFKRISWEEAIDSIATEWKRIRGIHGPSSSFVMYSWGVTSMVRPDNMIKRLLNLDGGFLGGYNTYSDAATVYISPYIYGDAVCGNSADDVLNTEFLILWGHNPAETIYGSERNYYLTKAKEKGIKVVVIDPRCSDSVIAYADEWIGIRPSTDSALADGMAYVIWSEGLYDKAFMDQYCVGFDQDHLPEGAEGEESYEEYLFGRRDNIPKTPEWAAAITGIEADKIRELARSYATAKPACILPGLGLQRTGNGEQTTRSLAMLACLTGNVGIKGGGSGGAIWTRSGSIKKIPTLEPAFSGAIPHFLWSKAVKEGKSFGQDEGLVGVKQLDSNIKMIFNLAGNTLINQHSNINETKAILQDERLCELIVCSDIFMTPSARFADLVLPATSGFETNNITPPWLAGDYILYNNQVRKPFFDCKFEWEWIRELAKKLNYQEAFDEGHESVEAWLQDLYGHMQVDDERLPSYKEFKEQGIFKWQESEPFVAYEQQIKDPANHPFKTPSGKIEIYSKDLRDLNNPTEIPAIPKYVPCVEGPEDPLRATYPLQLIGWHTKRRTHSIHDNNSLMEEVNPQTLWIHPSDARARQIENGDLVQIYNDRGVVQIKAQVTSRIVSGVVGMPQGAWYTPNKEGIDIRGNINVLTSTHKPTPVAKGNPQHTNLVEVVRATT